MWQFFKNPFLYWLCPGSRARYWAVNPLPAMVPSERKVTHTVLLFVFTVGGATLPQNLQRMVEDSRTTPLPAYSSISEGALPPSTDRLVLCQRVVILQRKLIKHLSIWTCFPSVLSTRRLNMDWLMTDLMTTELSAICSCTSSQSKRQGDGPSTARFNTWIWIIKGGGTWITHMHSKLGG